MKAESICFNITTMDQLMKVREYMMELAFQSIRNGEDPYEHFLAIDSACLIAINCLREHGWARIEIEEGNQGSP